MVVCITARNGFTGAPELVLPVVGICGAVEVTVESLVPMAAGGGDLVVVTCSSVAGEEWPDYTLIGGGVSSESSEGKVSFGSAAPEELVRV